MTGFNAITDRDGARPSSRAPRRFAGLAFAGGGLRCFWQGGFLAVVGPSVGLDPTRVTAVSGGALAGAAWIAGREERLLSAFRATIGARESNVSSWDEIGENGLTPHQGMYRDVVETTFDDDAVAAIADGPAFAVLLARPPSRLLPALSTLRALIAYRLDLRLRSTPRLRLPAMLGARGVRVDAREAARDGRLVDLICSAAVIPPVFKVRSWDEGHVMDGGMIDNRIVPDARVRGATLAVLARRFRNLPDDDTVWAEPSAAVPADRIDFTDPDQLDAAWAMGRRDGEAFLAACGWG